MTQENSELINKKTYFITGGGTGGHIYPAIAVANALKNDPDVAEVFYIGNPKKPEYNIAKENEIKFLPVFVSGMPRKITLGIVFWLLELGLAVVAALFYLLKYKPNAIFATGGYVSAPLIIACVLTKTSFMCHDGDTLPGIVSRKSAPYAKCISTAFEAAGAYLNNPKIYVNGNPVRPTFSKISKIRAINVLGLQEKTTLLIIGGSQGAKTLNENIVDLYKTLVQKYNVQIIHQTGAKNYDEVINRLEEIYPFYKNNESIIVAPYFDEMAIPMKAADIVISRAGSLSLSEISACALPSLLVPYPYAAGNHQLKNAKIFESQNAAICIEENVNLQSNLLSNLILLLSKPDVRRNMSEAARKLAKPNALNDIVKQLKSI